MNKTPRGFIIDAPNVLILSGDRTYSCVTATQGQIQFQGSTLEIKGGQSLYDLISIPTGTTLTVTLADARIDGDMLEMGMGATRVSGESREHWRFGTPYIVDKTTYAIEIPEEIKAETFKINGLTAATAEVVATGTFKVTSEANKTTVTFNEDMAGVEVMPTYAVTAAAESYDALNDALPKKGKVVLQFPVYSGDTEQSGIEAICQVTIWSAAINQNTTIGGSYKTASSFNLDIKGLDSKRPDKRIWTVDFFPYAV